MEGSRSAHDLTCHSAQELCPKVALSETWVPQTPLDYHDSHHFPYSCGYPIFRDTHLVNGLAHLVLPVTGITQPSSQCPTESMARFQGLTVPCKPRDQVEMDEAMVPEAIDFNISSVWCLE